MDHVHRIGRFTMHNREIADLIKAWLAISLAFAIVLGGLSFSLNFLLRLLAAGFTVGIGFLLHELGHKVLAQRYGIKAEFQAFDFMLLLAIAMSFFGFVFAAPGAVVLLSRVRKDQYGKISVIGPVINLALAIAFLVVVLFEPGKILTAIALYGFIINSWLALFNMIPFGPLDGRKVWVWNKAVYVAVLAVAIGFMIVQHVIKRPAFAP